MTSASFDSIKTPLQDLLVRDFYAGRAESLLARIEAATGKTVPREPELFRPGVVPECYHEDIEEWDAEEPLEEVAS